MEEANEDVLAALSYLNVTDGGAEESATSKQALPPSQSRSVSGPVGGLGDQQQQQQFKSSFAPSTSAAKRKAKAQAQQAAHHAATHKPGRANGRKKSRAAGAWNDSTDEEEDEEDEDEDEDADSDVEPVAAKKQGSASGHGPLPARPSVYGQFGGEGAAQQQQSSQLRAPRTLPQPPTGSRPGECC
jgi:CCR4-NOT transcriptional complex subunit CAF120